MRSSRLTEVWLSLLAMTDFAIRERQQRKMREQTGANIITFGHILDRIGEASNPGPSNKGCHSKQRRLGDFFQQHHTKKDDKDMWCEEKGYTIETLLEMETVFTPV
eukprot:15865414-Heterocapsa_arctica.AAC.1